MKHSLKTRYKMALAMAMSAYVSINAHAATSGEALPWEGPLDKIKASLTGPVAITISIIAIAGCGLAIIFGGEMNDFIKRLVYIVLVVSVVAFAAQIMTKVFGASSALIPFITG
jgi:type IV secretion system protein VirB2